MWCYIEDGVFLGCFHLQSVMDIMGYDQDYLISDRNKQQENPKNYEQIFKVDKQHQEIKHCKSSVIKIS